jgi:hypothetical protein
LSLAGLSPEDIASAFGVVANLAEVQKVPYRMSDGSIVMADPDIVVQLDAGKYQNKQQQVPYRTSDGRTIMVDPDTAARLDAETQQSKDPASVKEYEYAVKQGYKGSFRDFLIEQNRSRVTPFEEKMREAAGRANIQNLADIKRTIDSEVSREFKEVLESESLDLANFDSKIPEEQARVRAKYGVNTREEAERKLRAQVMDRKIMTQIDGAKRWQTSTGKKGWLLPDNTFIPLP